MSFSEVKPRHVLCLLGGERPFSDLCEMIQSAIESLAPGFEIDDTFSEDAPDDRMPMSFEVCRDRVKKGAWTEADEEAVSDHRSVIYVLGPPMTADDAVKHSAIALRLVAHTLDNGIVAAKGESAGVAHGVERWKELARDAEGQTGAALARPAASPLPSGRSAPTNISTASASIWSGYPKSTRRKPSPTTNWP